MLAPLCPNLVEDLSICLKLQALSTPPSASSLGEPDNPGPFNTNSTSREDAPILLKRRLEGIEDIDVQEAIIHTEKRCHTPSRLDPGEPSHTHIHLTTDPDLTQLNTSPCMGNVAYSPTWTSLTSTV